MKKSPYNKKILNKNMLISQCIIHLISVQNKKQEVCGEVHKHIYILQLKTHEISN